MTTIDIELPTADIATNSGTVKKLCRHPKYRLSNNHCLSGLKSQNVWYLNQNQTTQHETFTACTKRPRLVSVAPLQLLYMETPCLKRGSLLLGAQWLDVTLRVTSNDGVKFCRSRDLWTKTTAGRLEHREPRRDGFSPPKTAVAAQTKSPEDFGLFILFNFFFFQLRWKQTQMRRGEKKKKKENCWTATVVALQRDIDLKSERCSFGGNVRW